jgi:hypothetical protein
LEAPCQQNRLKRHDFWAPERFRSKMEAMRKIDRLFESLFEIQVHSRSLRMEDPGL